MQVPLNLDAGATRRVLGTIGDDWHAQWELIAGPPRCSIDGCESAVSLLARRDAQCR
jgi:hypothetical protein